MQNPTWSILQTGSVGQTEESTHLEMKIFRDFTKAYDGLIIIKSIEIIPVDSEENKSPIVVQDGHIGVKLWSIPHMFNYAYKTLLRESSKIDLQDIEKLSRCIVFCCPDCATAWNKRKEIILTKDCMVGYLQKELALSKYVLLQRPKSSETFAHRRWAFARIMQQMLIDFGVLSPHNIKKILQSHGDTGLNSMPHSCHYFDLETVFSLVREEFSICCAAGEKQKSNYNAWAHRAWVINILLKIAMEFHEVSSTLSCTCANKLHALRQSILCFLYFETGEMRKFSEKHISDISALTAALYSQTQWANLSLVFNIKNFSTFPEADVCNEIISEFLNSLHHNEKLIKLYDTHEALWCHRKNIFINFKKLLTKFPRMPNLDDLISKEFSQESETKFCQKFCPTLLENENMDKNSDFSKEATAEYYARKHFAFICKFYKYICEV